MSRLKSSVPFIVSLMATIFMLPPHLALSAPQHGLAMYGNPELPKGYTHLPYANPEAAQGGIIILPEHGGFDSLNPYILKGTAPWGVRTHMVETLLGQNYDEPFSLYGLLAETVETDDARSWVEFTLRPEARFSNGDQVTAEDVLWSFETLGTIGHPRYINSWRKVASSEITGPRSVKFTFKSADRELPLILGLRPILHKADWEGRDFTQSSLTPITGSGPYLIEKFEPNRFITFKKDPNYWGAHLGYNKGRHNFERVKYDYFADTQVIFETFKAGNVSIFHEENTVQWAENYDFPAVLDGKIIKSEIPHKRPSGMLGFVMNSRRPPLDDIRVRDALLHAFDFEFINKALNGGGLPRITSYFSNSVLSMQPGPATGAVADHLTPFTDQLPQGAMEGYSLPQSDGSGRNRRNLRIAGKLLDAAGWTIQDGVRRNAMGDVFELEILLKNNASENEAIMGIYLDSLKRLGIKARVKRVDPVQHREQMTNYDFDMAHYTRYMSLSPGNEQMLYWGRRGVDTPGTRNYMGMNSPAAEALIAKMLETRDAAEFQSIVRALDRVLISGRYVIPIWYKPVSLLAHDARVKYPEHLPMYGDWTGFLPEVWWFEE